MRAIIPLLVIVILCVPARVLGDDPIWATDRPSGEFVESTYVLDWGDIAPGTIVNAFSFQYATDKVGTLDATVTFYVNENGCDSSGRVAVAGFAVPGLPGTFNPPATASWIITVNLAAVGMDFPLIGPDLDGDGLTDFGYEIAFGNPGEGVYVGQAIADADPNMVPFHAPGIEDAWYAPECVVSPYGGDPFAQLFLYLYGTVIFDCPNNGASGNWCMADISNEDCIVDLADLAVLLSNYGVTSGATHDMGDLMPLGGDGAVDLRDLAEMLTEYGDDCN